MSVRPTWLIVNLLFMIEIQRKFSAGIGVCPEDGTPVARMCEDNTVSGSKVYADSGDIGLSILPCNCFVQADNGDVLSAEAKIRPNTGSCEAGVEFINFASCGTGSTPLATDITISVENYNESLTLEKNFLFFGEPTNTGYCIEFTIIDTSHDVTVTCTSVPKRNTEPPTDATATTPVQQVVITTKKSNSASQIPTVACGTEHTPLMRMCYKLKTKETKEMYVDAGASPRSFLPCTCKVVVRDPVSFSAGVVANEKVVGCQTTMTMEHLLPNASLPTETLGNCVDNGNPSSGPPGGGAFSFNLILASPVATDTTSICLKLAVTGTDGRMSIECFGDDISKLINMNTNGTDTGTNTMSEQTLFIIIGAVIGALILLTIIVLIAAALCGCGDSYDDNYY